MGARGVSLGGLTSHRDVLSVNVYLELVNEGVTGVQGRFQTQACQEPTPQSAQDVLTSNCNEVINNLTGLFAIVFISGEITSVNCGMNEQVTHKSVEWLNSSL